MHQPCRRPGCAHARAERPVPTMKWPRSPDLLSSALSGFHSERYVRGASVPQPSRPARACRAGSPRRFPGMAGTSFATGFPRFVISTGSPVLLTSSISVRQRALNSAAARIFMVITQLSWSLKHDHHENMTITLDNTIGHTPARLPSLPGPG